MAEKEKFNFIMPVALMREFDQAAQRYGPKRKWMVLAAAVKMLLEAPESRREDYVRQIGAADLSGPGAYDKMVTEVKAMSASFGKLVHEKEAAESPRGRAKKHESRKA